MELAATSFSAATANGAMKTLRNFMRKYIWLLLIWLGVSFAEDALAKPYGEGPYDLYDRNFAVRGSIKREELKKSQLRDVLNIEATDKADPNLFNKPVLFPSLQYVYLDSINNSTHLNTLAKYYRDLRGLTIEGKEVGADDLFNLNKFYRLKELYISGNILSREAFISSVPSSSRFLILRKTGVPNSQSSFSMKLPHLTDLFIHYETVDMQFIEALNAPRLRTVNIFYSEVKPGVLSELKKFPKLRELNMQKTKYDVSELERLRNLIPKLKIGIPDRAGFFIDQESRSRVLTTRS